MSEVRPSGAERTELRIQPYEASVNAVAGRTRGLWLGYLTLSVYLVIAVGSVTHRDLFLETPVRLPILNVDLPLTGFFFVAPLLFLLNHFYLLLSLLSLGRRIAEYNQAIGREVVSASFETALRRKLDSFVVVLALAGTEEERKRRTGSMLKAIAWITIVGVPVALLLFIQLTFLPYHDFVVTWVHRLVLVIDLGLLWVFWPAIRKGTQDLRVPRPWRFWIPNILNKNERKKPIKVPLVRAAVAPPAVLIVLSVLVATFPGEWLDANRIASFRFVPALPEWLANFEDRKQEYNAAYGTQTDDAVADESGVGWWARLSWSHRLSVYEILYLGDVDKISGRRWGFSSNTLILPDGDFVDDALAEKTRQLIEKIDVVPWHVQRTHVLRGRDLRGAVLARADLRYVDLTGANLQGADLSAAELLGADLEETLLQGANLERAELGGVDLLRAEIQQGNLTAAKLQGANLVLTQLQGAVMSRANLQGAVMSRAQLQGAVLTNAQLQGAVLRGAHLQGADLVGAQLHGADLATARLQGASLLSVQLQGANLLSVQLNGAVMYGAKIWQLDLPFWEDFENADRRGVVLESVDTDKLQAMLGNLSASSVRVDVRRRIARLLDSEKASRWRASVAAESWLRVSNSDLYNEQEVGDYLTHLACKDTAGGYVTRGVARNVIDFHSLRNAIYVQGMDMDHMPSGDILSGVIRVVAKGLSGDERCDAAIFLEDDVRSKLAEISTPNVGQISP